MHNPLAVAETTGLHFQRRLGSYVGTRNGPLVIGIGGLHGNEPAGALALQNVSQQLQALAPAFQGQFLALAGNLKALQQGVRYVEQDLNRMWSSERIRSALPHNTVEDAEQQELLSCIQEALAQARGRVIFLDLHTTSAEGAPFALISDTLVNRQLALQLQTPLILGLEESVEGTILNYVNELGHAAIGFEAGQHQAPQSIQIHEAAIWVILVEAGCLTPEQVPNFAAHRQTLQTARHQLPAVFEVRYRHAITEADAFVMQPGFANFHPVTQGQTVATDRHGVVRVNERGYLFMPLYQALGSDGFFLVREVKPFWLGLSARLRKMGADAWLHWLPGVHYLSGDKNALIINTQVARWFVLEICHLLGFRKYSRMGEQLVISRRKQAQT